MNVRAGTHTTLTETAELVVSILEKIPGVTKISPGIITKGNPKGGKRHITAVFTNAGMELIISGQGVQKVAAHCDPKNTSGIFQMLKEHKKLSAYIFKKRERRPGI